MVSMVVGLLILAAVTGIFVSMLNSNNDNLKSTRLNQDLRSVMSLMTRNLRRAGVDLQSAARANTSPVIDNPFEVEGVAMDQVINVTSNQSGTADKCISFSYDELTSGTMGVRDDPSELFGYRWDETNETVESRQNGLSCAVAGWEDMTDSSLILIKNLNFADTVTASGLPGLKPVREVTITLQGQLTSDSSVSRTLIETINIRNN